MKNISQLPCKILFLLQTLPTIFPYKEKKNPENEEHVKLKLKTNLFPEQLRFSIHIEMQLM